MICQPFCYEPFLRITSNDVPLYLFKCVDPDLMLKIQSDHDLLQITMVVVTTQGQHSWTFRMVNTGHPYYGYG